MSLKNITNQLIIQSFRLLGVSILPLLIIFLTPEQVSFKKSHTDYVLTEMSFEFIEADSFSFDNNETDHTNHHFIFEVYKPIAFKCSDSNPNLEYTYQRFFKEILDSGIFIPPPKLI